jgi:hypothetical protein
MNTSELSKLFHVFEQELNLCRFRRHKGADAKFMKNFIAEWTDYVSQLQRGLVFGTTLTAEQQAAMSQAQKLQLEQLKKSIFKQQ